MTQGKKTREHGRRLPKIALLWTQFSAYHVDRCEVVGRQLGDRAEVIAVEVATSSTEYAWSPSGAIGSARKITLFPDQAYELVGFWQRLRAQWIALRRCDMVCVGVAYSTPDIIVLTFLLRIFGVKVILMTDSKLDDFQRRVERELLKSIVLIPYVGAIVSGVRTMDFVRFLGMRQRPILLGYDTVGLSRVLHMGGGVPAPGGLPHAARPFVFVGRFVPKKAVSFLIDCYARYIALAGDAAHRLVLVGAGQTEGEVRSRIAAHGLQGQVDLKGFLQASEVAIELGRGLALILPSTEEQWGLVVNEALAFHLPILVSDNVGARDSLVRNLVNGFVVEPGSVEGMARAMLALSDEERWREMTAGSAQLAHHASADRFAEAVDQMLVLLKLRAE